MPTDTAENLTEFTDCMSEISALVEVSNSESVYVLGDFNAHPGEQFSHELINFCNEQLWSCVDLDLLPSDTYTYVSEAHGCRRWLDHCIVTKAARQSVVDVSVLNQNVYWSDHYPLCIECDINKCLPKLVTTVQSYSKVRWGVRDESQILKYTEACNARLRLIDFPEEFRDCADKICCNIDHKLKITALYQDIVCALKESAEGSYNEQKRKKYKCKIGWNKHVRDAHREAQFWYRSWLQYGKPSSGFIYNKMRDSKRYFKAKVKYVQNNESQIKLDIIAQNHRTNNFKEFWKNTNKLNPKLSIPASVAGKSDPIEIANAFGNHFKVVPEGGAQFNLAMFDAESSVGNLTVRFTAREVDSIIRGMARGKSPGHDELSIEHLKYAGVHLPRVLSLLFNLCVSHCYLPEDVMFTVVVPIIKNKLGDASDLSNYRPISLATVIAKVLDGLLDRRLGEHIQTHDAQFGFKPGLSTESAIFCLKQTVQYYTARKTPIYACFLDLSKAFDLVSYNLLWSKLQSETTVPPELTSLFKYWYDNQRNCVRWTDSKSDVYGLQCGVR
ncbi:hypothetical protein ABMA27_016978 [Loxostege sticticalis]|uniref:Reverse transcriptase domain-containing protein n=1 Tax=Loxostege sticticalis TaxID=481309 RepID=A0ABR3GYN4_LOXSC